MLLLDGKKVRKEKIEGLKKSLQGFDVTPTLAILQIGENERSKAYIDQKIKFSEIIGAQVKVFEFSNDTSKKIISEKIQELNKDNSVHGIIVQLPLPVNFDADDIIANINPNKDVDGLTAINMQKLIAGRQDGFLPATAKGVLSLLDYYKIPISGSRVVVVGRSVLVGKSIALSILAKDATVTICHHKTRDLASITKDADILIIAIGQARFIGRDYVKEGQTVLDVGINVEREGKLEEEINVKKLVGDVDFEEVKDLVGAISPVPGGVGPMTVVSLFENLVQATKRSI